MIVAITASGIWAVYWSVINTYNVEQREVNIQAEGERIIDLIINGGYHNGRAIYGLNSMSAVSGYPLTGQRTIASPIFNNDSDDYRIEYPLDFTGGNTRYAEFSVEFSGANIPTSKLWFRLRTDGVAGDEHNYDVNITENFLQRKSGTVQDAFGEYDKTWFKTQELSSVSGYCSGLKLSFYLADVTQLIHYNYRLDREPDPPINNPDQERAYMNGIPYPEYFSTTVYFPNRK